MALKFLAISYKSLRSGLRQRKLSARLREFLHQGHSAIATGIGDAGPLSQRFIRCPHCGMPHNLGEAVCPTTGKPLRRVDSIPGSQKGPAPGSLPISFGVSAKSRPAPKAPARTGSLVGRIISEKYGVKNVIGEGGMGTVYEAEHLTIGRRVAIKVLNQAHLGRREAVIRFYNEARAAGSIGHPNICEVYDVGRLDDGSPYLVMELLQGKTLAERISLDGALPFDEVIDVVTQVLSALAAAHGKTIIHRDIKPDNVFLSTRPGCPPIAKLLDFGISKTESDDPDLALTRTGMVMGTPFYMAPEQARGEPIDYRVDLYACGVILYESLTGRRPFIASNYNSLVIQVLSAEPRNPREIRPAIPAGFLPIISKAMAKGRELRYRSAIEFLEDLSALKGQLSRGMSASDIAKFVQDVHSAVPASTPHGSPSDRDSVDIPVVFSETGTGQNAAADVTPLDLQRDSVDIPFITDDTPDEARRALDQYEPRKSSPLSRKTKPGSDFDEVNDTIVDSSGILGADFWAQVQHQQGQLAQAGSNGSAVRSSQSSAELRRYDFDSQADDESFRLQRPGDTTRPPESQAGRYFMVQVDGEDTQQDHAPRRTESVAPEFVIEVTASEPPPASKPRASSIPVARIEPTRVARPAASAPPRSALGSDPKVPRPTASAAPASQPTNAIEPSAPWFSDDEDDEETRLYSHPGRASLRAVDLSGHNNAKTERAPAPESSETPAVRIAPRPPGTPKF